MMINPRNKIFILRDLNTRKNRIIIDIIIKIILNQGMIKIDIITAREVIIQDLNLIEKDHNLSRHGIKNLIIPLSSFLTLIWIDLYINRGMIILIIETNQHMIITPNKGVHQEIDKEVHHPSIIDNMEIV